MRIAAAPRSSGTPRRLVRPRGRNADRRPPVGAAYVGRPTLLSNPFERRPGISHARSVILYRAWLNGELSIPILHSLRFGEDEIVALGRWRRQLLGKLPDIEGKDLQCWCPLTSPWCHAEVLLSVANPKSEVRHGVR